MAVDDFEGEAVLRGQWLYAGAIPKTIEVVAFDCDYFFDRMPCDDGREPWEPHPLNSEGVLYYLKPDGEILPLRPFRAVEEARAWADMQPWAPIQWE